MPLFRRRHDGDDDAGQDEFVADQGDQEDESAPGGPTAPAAQRLPGPWDADEVDDDVARIDLGALRVPVPEGCEVRIDVQDDQVVAATLVDGRSALQIHAFAAPRRAGIWDEVRAEIAASLREGGGSAEEVPGPFGTELKARIPTPVEGQGLQHQPARFLGVDGPRWFLRGLMTGAGSTDPQQARLLESAFRGVVVVRGGEAMAPRDLLPLRLPREAVVHADADIQDEAAQASKPTLEMLQRGPEITETR